MNKYSNSSLSNISKKNTLTSRIKFIKQITSNNSKNTNYSVPLEPLVDFDQLDTEYYTNYNNGSASSEGSFDTKTLLKKRTLNFNHVIQQMTENTGKLDYIKSGTTGHTFKVCATDKDGSYNFGIKVVAYPKRKRYGTIYDSRRPENAELLAIKLLAYFITKKKTPHITLPIATFNTDIKKFIGLIDKQIVEPDNEKYIEFEKDYYDGKFHDEVSILISEWANKGDLSDYINKNCRNMKELDWKVIFFQLISVLAQIQLKYPSFRHNDLKANNILVHEIEGKGKIQSYPVNKKKYKVPNVGIRIKLWDFDFACVPGIVDNIKVNATSEFSKSINVTPVENKYYDMHFFFNTLIRFHKNFMKQDYIPQSVKDFILRVVPLKYQKDNPKIVTEKGRILINEEYTTPLKILENDPFFEEFRVKQISTIKEPINKTKIFNKPNITPPKYENINNLSTDVDKYIELLNKKTDDKKYVVIENKPNNKVKIDVAKFLSGKNIRKKRTVSDDYN
jgi:serine/threonine protein kinase